MAGITTWCTLTPHKQRDKWQAQPAVDRSSFHHEGVLEMEGAQPPKGYALKEGPGQAHLVGAINLELDGHARGGLVALGGAVRQRLVLLVGVVLGHHHVEHHAGVADAQVLALAALELRQVAADTRPFSS